MAVGLQLSDTGHRAGREAEGRQGAGRQAGRGQARGLPGAAHVCWGPEERRESKQKEVHHMGPAACSTSTASISPAPNV